MSYYSWGQQGTPYGQQLPDQQQQAYYQHQGHAQPAAQAAGYSAPADSYPGDPAAAAAYAQQQLLQLQQQELALQQQQLQLQLQQHHQQLAHAYAGGAWQAGYLPVPLPPQQPPPQPLPQSPQPAHPPLPAQLGLPPEQPPLPPAQSAAQPAEPAGSLPPSLPERPPLPPPPPLPPQPGGQPPLPPEPDGQPPLPPEPDGQPPLPGETPALYPQQQQQQHAQQPQQYMGQVYQYQQQYQVGQYHLSAMAIPAAYLQQPQPHWHYVSGPPQPPQQPPQQPQPPQQQPPQLPPQPPQPPQLQPQSQVQAAPPAVDIMTLLRPPGRRSRPRRLALLLRGLPGCGKSHAARLLRQEETAQGGDPPRVFSLDDYFMTEVEREEEDGEVAAGGKAGRKRTVTTLEYVYEAEMEEQYTRSLARAFQRAAAAASHAFLVVDAPSVRAADVAELWSVGEAAGYEVFVAEPVETDPEVCHRRNVHGRSLQDVRALAARFEPTPAAFARVDLAPLLLPGAPGRRTKATDITEVDMGADSEGDEPSSPPEAAKGGHAQASRWGLLEEAERPAARASKRAKRESAAQAAAAGTGTVPGRPRGILSPGGGGSGRRVRWPDLEAQQHEAAGGFRIGGGAQLETVHVLSGLGPPPEEGRHHAASFDDAVRAEHRVESDGFRKFLLGKKP